MLTLNTTVAATDANSYVSLQYADEYWESHFLTTRADAWAALDDNQKTTALIAATRIIETARFTVSAVGSASTLPTRYSSLQALQFPRNYDVDASLVAYVPEAVMMAQCEQAAFLLSLDQAILTNALQGLWYDSMKAGDVQVTQQFRTGGTVFAPMALEFLKPYLIRGSAMLRRG